MLRPGRMESNIFKAPAEKTPLLVATSTTSNREFLTTTLDTALTRCALRLLAILDTIVHAFFYWASLPGVGGEFQRAQDPRKKEPT